MTEKLEQLYEGKAKRIFRTGSPGFYLWITR
jgi:phosphoribosylaminoimidazole-succinocarboxamide synthase